MGNEQDRDLQKLEADAVADEFVPITNNLKPVAPPSAASLEVAGWVLVGATAVCGAMAAKRGSHWLLSEKECGQLHMAVARVAEKYINFDSNNPLYTLAGVAGSIVLSRLAIEFVNGDKQMERPIDGDKPEHKVAE